MSKHSFQAEVNQLLDLMIHSLYSNREIFLRELVSNASDALDKLKFLNVSDDRYKQIAFDPKIQIRFDTKDRKWLEIEDNGIGMNDQDLVENLGTIAKSGTKNFVSQLTGDRKKDSNLIGQFGVGFYSAFMVSDSIEVIAKKAGEDKAWKWTSDGKGEYTIEESSRESFGATIRLNLKEDAKEFANRWTLESAIKKYSNHIPFPIFLEYEQSEYDDQGKEKGKTQKNDQIGSATALWKRPKNSIKPEEYQEFYKTISHDSGETIATIHTQAEGALEYTTLFFIPAVAPFDLYRMDYRSGVKLYVKRVFITDDDKELLPSYLRFVRGVIDSEDLPLNVSREILQQNKILANIKNASVKKILNEIKKLSEDKEKYAAFHKEFGRCVKEGLYSDYANREELIELARFKTTASDGLTGFAEYKTRMKPDQKAIYYIAGLNESLLRNSPLLESFKAQNIEVLIMDDEIDEFAISQINEYKDLPLKAINKSGANDDLPKTQNDDIIKAAEPIAQKVKKALGEEVKEVKISSRLASSPACLVLDENDPSVQMRQMYKMMGDMPLPDIKPILELNPSHEIVQKIGAINDENLASDVSFLLFEQAQLVAGMTLKDPAAFGERLSRILNKAI
ncbi:MAG: molecular chaperone HtpG [Helicobacteraceae bacterium]|jgi:molecular chaperone HtpG|nr:molecular chaperone HtpG [Helicobacteraceae bacterium]